MVNRICNPIKSNSFFLFGPRGSGKSTLLKQMFPGHSTFWLDLLDDDQLDKYSLRPQELKDELSSRPSKKIEWVVIDEVQKCPKLLNVVHQIIESSRKIKFALTGSSARKLKQKGVNLLAGRAWIEYLYPLSYYEVKDSFDLIQTLQWGSLPHLIHLKTPQEKSAYLRSYGLTYLRTEIQEEQWVRKIDPFRRFLSIAAQMNGKILNYSNMARDVGVDTTTIQSYYEILEDTLLGFTLPAYHRSIRKQQRKAPKFYLFDCGVKRALERKLNVVLSPSTSEFGDTFEHWIILEIHKLNLYYKKDFELYYFLSKEGLEIDLVIDRPGAKTAFIEIKSKMKVDDRDTRHLELISKGLDNVECYIFSQDPVAKKIGSVHAYHWTEGIQGLFD